MLLKVLVLGVALSSLWFWIYSLIKREISSSMLKWWIKVVVPQGLVIAYALILLGAL